MRGPAGRDAKVTCRLAKNARKVSCSMMLEGKQTRSNARAKLTRNGRTYAHGSLASLRPSGTIRRGTYTLRAIVDGRHLAFQVRLL